MKIIRGPGLSPEDEARLSGELSVAIRSNNKDLVKSLISQGANVNVIFVGREISRKDTPLTLAIETNNPEIVKVLLDAAANPYLNQTDKQTLFFAISQGNLDIVKLLLEHGMDPKELNLKNETPLMYAKRLVDEGDEKVKPILNFLSKQLFEKQREYVKKWQEKINY